MPRYSGRWRPSLVKTENVPVAQSDLDGVLASLSAWFAANKNPGAAVDFLVSSRFVRFALIPWSGALTSQEEQAALMLARFSEQYGDMSEWQMAADEAGDYGQPSLAFALPDRLLAGLSKLCNEFKLHCRQVQPYAVASLNAYARTSKASFYAIVEKRYAGSCSDCRARKRSLLVRR